jgi:hypothetical protein
MIGLCESCGRDDEDVLLVRRLYITPEAWDTPGKVEEGGEERWCFVCRTHYPHDQLEPGPGPALEHRPDS